MRRKSCSFQIFFCVSRMRKEQRDGNAKVSHHDIATRVLRICPFVFQHGENVFRAPCSEETVRRPTSQLNSISASMVMTLTLNVLGCFFFKPKMDILPRSRQANLRGSRDHFQHFHASATQNKDYPSVPPPDPAHKNKPTKNGSVNSK